MDLLTALYGIGGLDVPEEVTAFRKRPELLKLFMDEFLAESDEFLDGFAGGEDEEDYFEMDDRS